MLRISTYKYSTLLPFKCIYLSFFLNSQGDKAECFYIVESGEVKIMMKSKVRTPLHSFLSSMQLKRHSFRKSEFISPSIPQRPDGQISLYFSTHLRLFRRYSLVKRIKEKIQPTCRLIFFLKMCFIGTELSTNIKSDSITLPIGFRAEHFAPLSPLQYRSVSSFCLAKAGMRMASSVRLALGEQKEKNRDQWFLTF